MKNKIRTRARKPDKYQSPYGDVVTHGSYRNTIKPMIEFLETKQTGICLEIGVFGGSTLLGVYDTCKSRDIEVYGVDPWENITNANGFTPEQIGEDEWANRMIAKKKMRERLQNIISAHSLNIKLFQNTSEAIVDCFEDGSIDCIHVDGDHSYEGVISDMNLYWPKLKSSGMMLMDDYIKDTWPEVFRATNDFINTNIKEIDTHQGFMTKMKIIKK